MRRTHLLCFARAGGEARGSVRAEALLHELVKRDRRDPNPRWRTEAHRVIDQMVGLYGDSYWSSVWRSEVAQLDGDYASAREHALPALNMIEGQDNVRGLIQVAWCFLSLPGSESAPRNCC